MKCKDCKEEGCPFRCYTENGECSYVNFNEDSFDWQSFRAEAAKDILTGIVAHSGVSISSTDAHGLTKLALTYADELVKQLAEKVHKETESAVTAYAIEEIFPELCESEDDRIRKALIRHIKDKVSVILGWRKEELIAWLEKQGEQNHTDKVEPKFKVGDWVVYNRNDSSREILYVYDIRNSRYYFNDNIHFSWHVKECDEKCHLWTIQDAKDGDVLSQDSIPFIFKCWDNNCIVYCGITDFGLFKVVEDDFSWCNGINVTPATKEQCDLLFQKMKEEGYEWNADKKELKKIEQKPAWSEEDEDILDIAIRIIQNGGDDCAGILDSNKALRWLKSLKDRVQPQPKQEWDEEDERAINDIIVAISMYANGEIPYTLPSQLLKDVERLRSIKPKHWKPSEEQMDNLRAVISFLTTNSILGRGVESLYNDLKKL